MKITMENKYKSASVGFPHDDASLPEVITELENLLKIFGYCFDGELEVIPKEEERNE